MHANTAFVQGEKNPWGGGTLLSPATKWKGDIGMGAVRPSFRPSVLPSVRPSRFVSGAEHKNRERYLNQTWYIDRSSGELVPFDSLGFFGDFLGIWDFFGGFFFVFF